PSTASPQHGARNTGCEQYMYNQISAARAKAGRAGLAFDSGIQYIALSWSDGMSGRQVLAHNPNYANQILRHRDYRVAGENVGRGYEQGSLFQAFMDSPGHRQNIESVDYTHVTVGCLTDANGQLWVTQNFWS
ncbi:MAG: CAP domain-containing protein, partial [Acidimicrobiales bacterium]